MYGANPTFSIFMSYLQPVHQLQHHTSLLPTVNDLGKSVCFTVDADCSLIISTMRFSTSTTTALLLALANNNGVALAFTPSRTTTSARTSSSSSSSSSSSFLALSATSPRTLYDKIWDDHLVDDDGQSSLLYIDRHLVHEVTSPQAFEGLRLANRSVRRPDCTLCTVDHNVPTTDRSALLDVASFITETASRTQVVQMTQNMADFNLPYFGIEDERQGIVHIIGPEQGFTLPGCTTVCGDSHTATHGAFGALAFGIGTSEVEHVLATQVSKRSEWNSIYIR
jgi:hypothetical protein